MFTVFNGHRALLAISCILSALQSALFVGLAFILERILNIAIARDWALLHKMVWVCVCYVVIVAISIVLDSRTKKKLIVCTLRDMRQAVYNGIISRDAAHFGEVNTADYISALTNDMNTIEENALLAPLQMVGYAFVFLMSAAALFYYSPLIVGILLLCLVAMYILPVALGTPIGKRQQALSQSMAMFTVRLKDRLSGYDVIRSFRLTDRAKQDFATQNEAVSEQRDRVDKMMALSEGLSQALSTGTQFLVMLFSAYLVLSGNLTAGAMLGIVQLSGAFTQPVAIIMQGLPKIKGAQPILARINSMSEKRPSAFSGTTPPEFRESISFEKVSFGYAPDQRVLHAVSARLDKNKKYALIGASGSGKTTLIRLMGADFGGYTGQIKMDGLEFRDMDMGGLRAKLSVIHQNVYMFDETIAENISLHREYSPEAWRDALAVSGVSKFIDALPDGLATQVGENGANLSGGQRQRVAVARALIEKKPILILDEGTSGVDAPTAYDIETALLYTPGITMLTVTHNLNPDLLRKYDSVLFMDNGQIAETGSYDELIASKGSFSEFVRLQHDETE